MLVVGGNKEKKPREEKDIYKGAKRDKLRGEIARLCIFIQQVNVK